MEQAPCPLSPYSPHLHAQAITEVHKQVSLQELWFYKGLNSQWVLQWKEGSGQYCFYERVWLVPFSSHWTLTWWRPTNTIISMHRILSLNNKPICSLFPSPLFVFCSVLLFLFSLSLFYSSHIPLQLHISILPLDKSSSLISCPRFSLSSLFHGAAYNCTIKQEWQCGH